MEENACKQERIETFLEKVKQKIIMERDKLQSADIGGDESLERFRGATPAGDGEKKDYASSLEGEISMELDNLADAVTRAENIIGEFSKIV